MANIAVFPGSFDPITKGHEDIVRRASDFYDEIVVAVGKNSTKSGFFPVEKRVLWIEQCFSDLKNVRCEEYSGLTVDFCNSIGAKIMLRGLRNGKDFDYEMAIAQMSAELDSKIETVLMFTSPSVAPINSSIVREIIKNKGDVSAFLPENVNVYED